MIGVTSSSLATADNFVEISTGITSNSNVTRGFLDSDQYRDESLDLDLTVGHFFQLQPGRSIITSATFSGSRFDELEGLDRESIRLGSSYQHKFGLGAYAPTFGAALNWTQDNSRGKTRDRHVATVEFSYSKQLSLAWRAMIGTTYESSEGINDGRDSASLYSPRNDIFDFEQLSLFGSADYLFANATMLTFSYTWIDGYTVSSALAPNPRLLAISRALTLDPAVTAPPGRSQVAYTLPTRAHLLSLNWSIPIGRDSSINLGYARQEISAKDSVEYANDQFSVTYMLAL